MGLALLALAASVQAQSVARVGQIVENELWKIEVLGYERTDRRENYRLVLRQEGLTFWKVTFRFLKVPTRAKGVKDVEVQHRLVYAVNGIEKSVDSRTANVTLDGTIELLFPLPPEAHLKRLYFNARVTPRYADLWPPLPPAFLDQRPR
ncbi:MAG: hypothetical protein HYY96_13115 [Candidatus Tectomicrobia bacterium]|nr:hypothetical protein [Candidatus Tectomicrobia bacterium]